LSLFDMFSTNEQNDTPTQQKPQSIPVPPTQQAQPISEGQTHRFGHDLQSLPDFITTGSLVYTGNSFHHLTGSKEAPELSTPLELDSIESGKLIDYLRLRDAYLKLQRNESENQQPDNAARNELNTAYDRFTRKHGFINDSKNQPLLEADNTHAWDIAGLERMPPRSEQ